MISKYHIIVHSRIFNVIKKKTPKTCGLCLLHINGFFNVTVCAERCVGVQSSSSVDVLFMVRLSPFLTFTQEKKRSFHLSDLKLTGTVSHSLSMGSPSTYGIVHFCSTTTSVQASGEQSVMAVRGLMVTAFSTSFCSALLPLEKNTFWPDDL